RSTAWTRTPRRSTSHSPPRTWRSSPRPPTSSTSRATGTPSRCSGGSTADPLSGRTAMEQHVIAAELSATGAQELLAARSSAHLAYNAEDGTPRGIPVGFFWAGTEFVVSTATTAPKVAALKARPDV